MSNPLRESIEISLRENGTFLCVRKLEGVVIDRYTTSDLKLQRKSKAAWIERVHRIANKLSANVIISVPTIPSVQPPLTERLEREIVDLREHVMQMQYEAEFKTKSHPYPEEFLRVEDEVTPQSESVIRELCNLVNSTAPRNSSEEPCPI